MIPWHAYTETFERSVNDTRADMQSTRIYNGNGERQVEKIIKESRVGKIAMENQVEKENTINTG